MRIQKQSQFQRIPFLPRFHTPILEGRKTMTARTMRYGGKGDVVDSPVGPLVLLSVRKQTLSYVRNNCWKEEGCESPQDFEAVWSKLHPRYGYNGRLLVWLHKFKVLDPKVLDSAN